MLTDQRQAPLKPLPLKPLLICAVGLMLLILWQSRPNELTLPALPPAAQHPLAFEPNMGQSNPAVLYQARGLGGSLFFTQAGVTYALPNDVVAEMAFLGAHEEVRVTAVSPLPGKVNYFSGSDPANWQQNVPTFEAIRYEALYDGIDAEFDGLTGTLKGTYTVAPQANPGQIRWHYPLATGLTVDASGNLLIGLAGADEPLIEQAPVAWQEVGGVKTAVSVSYAIAADDTVGFTVGTYNSALPLIIDPTVTFSSYYGGSADECRFERCAIAVDSDGNIFLTGPTNSADFPIVNEYADDPPDGSTKDVFVVKLAPGGSSVLFSTYIDDGDARGIDVDAAGNVYVVGTASNDNFPTTATKISDCDNGVVDIMVAKLSSDGSQLLYSTCVGGDSFDRGFDIAIDGSSNMIVTGYSSSDDFPLQNAAQPTRGGAEDAVIFKINAAGSALVYSTFWGGDRRDWAFAVDVDDAGNAYFGGRASSEDFPTTSGVLEETYSASQDGFVAKVNAVGTIQYSTLTSIDSVNRPNREVADLAVDGAGNVYLLELGTSFRGVRKFNPTATQQLYATEIEMSFVVEGKSSLAIDSIGRVVVTGERPGEFDGGDKDLLVAGLTENGRLVYEETFGRNDFARGLGVALYEHGDGRIDAYIVGETDDAQFPTSNPVQANLNGSRDMVVFNLINIEEALVSRDIYLPFIIR